MKYLSQSCTGATNTEKCFVGRIKQRGPMTDGGATVDALGQDNYR